jgi:folate-binding protein YgfZ
MSDIRGFELRPGVVVVHGPDAGSFLQNLLSQDLDPIAVGHGAPALLLQPQGKLVATLYALRVDEAGWWCVTDEGGAGALADGLNRFRIRVKVEVEDLTETFGGLAVRGDDAAGRVASVSIGAARVVPRMRGVDIVGPRADVNAARAELLAGGMTFGSDAEYEAARIAAGVPRLGRDIDERTIPQEAFLEIDAVSFTKGCFVGQELVCRIDTRGHVNRYLRRIHAESNISLPVGAEVLVDDRVVGNVTSAAGSDALAMVRREIDPPAAVRVRVGDGEVSGQVEAL